jgi:carbamoyl-phosphate synthase large subunit
VSGTELSCDFYVDGTGRTLGLVARERRQVRAGESVDTRVVPAPNGFASLVEALSTTLGYRGPGCAQGIAGPDGSLALLEVNARFGGASAVSAPAGLNLAELVLREAVGAPLPELPVPAPLRLVRLPEDRLSW